MEGFSILLNDISNEMQAIAERFEDNDKISN